MYRFFNVLSPEYPTYRTSRVRLNELRLTISKAHFDLTLTFESIMDEELKEWIDNATYHQLYERWRSASPTDKILHGETCRYYMRIMMEKKYQPNRYTLGI